MESSLPRGIPSVTYLSISSAAAQAQAQGQGGSVVANDLVVDGNAVGVNEPGRPTVRLVGAVRAVRYTWRRASIVAATDFIY